MNDLSQLEDLVFYNGRPAIFHENFELINKKIFIEILVEKENTIELKKVKLDDISFPNKERGEKIKKRIKDKIRAKREKREMKTMLQILFLNSDLKHLHLN